MNDSSTQPHQPTGGPPTRDPAAGSGPGAPIPGQRQPAPAEPGHGDPGPRTWSPRDLAWIGQEQPQVDLRILTRALGLGATSLTAAGPRALRIRLLEQGPVPVRGEPLAVDGVIDGIQQHRVLGRRQHRPLVLAYTSAGCSQGQRLVHLEERLQLICSHLDADTVLDLDCPIPVTVLDEHWPQHVAAAALAAIDAHRQAQERHVVGTAPRRDGVLLVDGPIGEYGHRPTGLVGVVKTFEQCRVPHELLPTEHGWRSPALLIPPRTRTGTDVYSCYLRLHPTTEQLEESHGLIRLESQHLEHLDALAAYCLLHRQGPGSGDPRWPVHLGSVALTEDLLRARLPLALTLSA